MKYLRVPASRVGALIGPGGKTKRHLEKLSGCKIKIDSKEGLVEIVKENEKDALKNLQMISAAKAIGRGFNPEIAYQLIEMDYYFEIIDIRDYVGRSKKRLGIIRGRLIGRGGKTRHIIEDMTGCKLAIQGHTVSIISDLEGLEAAKVAISMVLSGSEHGSVYKYLESFRRRMH
ncbi:MAG TPA: KH domain-containing protein [Flavobacteriales bacterium]|nr:KH domain-containing protein [Flavobacteriales bacterium]